MPLRLNKLLNAVADGLDLADALHDESKRVVKNARKKVKSAKTPGDAVRAAAEAVSDDAIAESANTVGDHVLSFLRHIDSDDSR